MCVSSILSLGRFAELLVAFHSHVAEGNGKHSGLSLLQLSCAAYRGQSDVHYIEVLLKKMMLLYRKIANGQST